MRALCVLIGFCWVLAAKKTVPESASGLFCSFVIEDGSSRIPVVFDSLHARFYPFFKNAQCTSPDSVQVCYGYNFHIHKAGKVHESIAFGFYFTARKDSLLQQQEHFVFSTHARLAQRLKRHTWTYLPAFGCFPEPAVTIAYTDSAGVMWRSYALQGRTHAAQQTSSFQITHARTVECEHQGLCEVITGSFRCTLYNAAGDSLRFPQGKFKAIVHNPL